MRAMNVPTRARKITIPVHPGMLEGVAVAELNELTALFMAEFKGATMVFNHFVLFFTTAVAFI
jgi:hypothetical protein